MIKSEKVEAMAREFINAIEAGLSGGKWVRPWQKTSVLPVNASTGKIFSGTNFLYLLIAGGGYFATNKQWKGMDAAIQWDTKPVAHGVLRPLFKKFENTKGKNELRLIGFAGYNLYSAHDQKGWKVPASTPLIDFTPIEAIEKMITACGATINHGGDKAYYRPASDSIQLPNPHDFSSIAAYYDTVIHELVHWTGHKSRIDRKLDNARFGDNAYSFEELIAELGATIISAHLGIDQADTRDNHYKYVAHWLDILKGDGASIMTAASKAQKAADYLLKGVVT